MKISVILITAWLCFGSAGAQQVTEKHIGFSGKESLVMKIQIADSITIQTWPKNEVYATASVNINDNKDNAAYLITFDDSGNSVSINAEFDDKYFKGKKNDCCNETNIYWQVFIPEKTNFSIETINGNITINGKTEKIKAKSISGYIDLAVPSGRNADVDFSTITGTIYSNHDLAFAPKHTGVPAKIKGKINNGGNSVILETISGDIFFRKSKSE